jgi:hypothetical protein
LIYALRIDHHSCILVISPLWVAKKLLTAEDAENPG